MSEKVECRCCLTRSNIKYFSNDFVGNIKLTYKEMFEASLGYKILPTEPQYFCVSCSQNLINWYKFKKICKCTQDMLLLAAESNNKNVEVSGDVHYDPNSDIETEFVCDEITEEPERTIKTETEELNLPPQTESYVQCDQISMETIENTIKEESYEITIEQEKMTEQASPTIIIENSVEPFELTFKVFIRHFVTKPSALHIGDLTVVGRTMPEFLHQIWLYVKPHLKRKVLFIDDKIISPCDEHPQEDQLLQFISIEDVTKINIASNIFSDNGTLKELKKYEKKIIYLFVHPYSNNVKTSNQFIAYLTLLKGSVKNIKLPVRGIIFPKSNQIEIDDEAEEIQIPEIINYPLFLRAYCSQAMEKNKSLGFIQLKCATKMEFLKDLWIKVKQYLKREIVFDAKGENPKWHPHESPQEKDLLRFITFRDEVLEQNYELNKLSSFRFKTITKNRTSIFVLPYSMNVWSLTQWKMLEKLIHKEDYMEFPLPLQAIPEPPTKKAKVTTEVPRYEFSKKNLRTVLENQKRKEVKS